jgi:RimJ/RimL family protein N-acetyltransferase
VLVFFGCIDPDNLTGKVISAMAGPEFDGVALDVVLGAANPHRKSIAEQLCGRQNARLMVQVDNIADLMAAADLAVGAGGGTTWERMCMGLPTVVVTIAENQVPAIRDLQALGLLRWAGDVSHMDQPSLRAQIADAVADIETNRWQSTQGMQLVDGHGAAHVADLLCGLGEAKVWKLRRAHAGDRVLYWHWANDPVVRASAIHTAQIPWENHCRWFDNMLACPNKWLFVAEGTVGPIGQVRFERSVDEITIHYSVAVQFRGQGQATILLEQAMEQLKVLVGHDACLHATVRIHNEASARVFQRLGFAEGAIENAGLRIFRRRLGG